jgi:uncharacterized membrane protein required for colicin V production
MLNFIDLLFGVVIVLAMARGWSRGLLSTIATYTAPVLGFMIAADMSDPMRDKLATMIDAPDIALDLLAPLVVFVLVVAVVRFLAAILARLLGVGLSLPGRVLGAAASGAVLAVILGAGVLMVDEVSPLGGRAAREGGTQPPEHGTDPLADLVVDVDRQLENSVLAPRLASLATTVWQKVSGKSPDEPLLPAQEIEQAGQKAGESVQKAGESVQREATEAIQRNALDAARRAAGMAPLDPVSKPPSADAGAKQPGTEPAPPSAGATGPSAAATPPAGSAAKAAASDGAAKPQDAIPPR